MKLSKTGFGCYRIDNRVEEHYSSLYKALAGGITVIDTSANYSDGRSEILVGNVLLDILSEGKINREDITLVTKGGYIQGQNYKFALKKKEQGIPFNEVVEIGEGLWHSISPDFLEDQISRQLFRLNQNNKEGYIDVYLLHNPEYYLTWAEKNGIDKNIAHEEYYFRIKKAFEFLEDKVSEGKIKSYGISSNTFPSNSGKYNFTSLEKVLLAAKMVSENNNFRFVEFPFNLIESGAALEKNQEENTKSVIEYACENNIRVLINRPLNAITGKGLVRLSDFEFKPVTETELNRQIKFLCLIENDILNEKIVNFKIPPEDVKLIKSLLSFGKTFKENFNKFGTIEHLNDIIENYFSPRINYLVDYFEDNISDDFTTENINKYFKEVFRLFNYVISHYKQSADKRSKYLHRIINEIINPENSGMTLSEKAILILSSIKGVDCVLTGARKESYVEEIIKINGYEIIENAFDILVKIHTEINKEKSE